MKKFPFVSVVVPVFNEERYILQCLQALCSQTYPSSQYEIIIVDDESTDSSRSLCLSLIAKRKGASPEIRYYRMPHGGLSRTRNAGTFYSQGEIVVFIDGDAVADSKWLEELVSPFRSQSDLGIVGGRVETLNTDSPFARFIHYVHYARPGVGLGRVIGTNMAYRRKVFDEYGGFYHLFEKRGDETTVNRLVTQTYQFEIADGAVVYHERPTTLGAWLKMRYENGLFGLASRKAVNARTSAGLTAKIILFASLINRVLNLLFWPLLITNLTCSASWARLSFTMALVPTAIRYLARGTLFRLANHLRGFRPNPVVAIAFGIPVFVLGVVWADIGWIVGFFRYFGSHLFVNSIDEVFPIEQASTDVPDKE